MSKKDVYLTLPPFSRDKLKLQLGVNAKSTPKEYFHKPNPINPSTSGLGLQLLKPSPDSQFEQQQSDGNSVLKIEIQWVKLFPYARET